MTVIIKNSVKIWFFALLFMIFMSDMIIPASAYEGCDSLDVEVRIHNGETLIAKEDCPFYSSRPIDFIINCDSSCDMFYSLSVDGGKTFGRFVRTDSPLITLYPDPVICPSGEFGIKFRAVSTVNDEARNYESRIFKVIFDCKVPEITVANESVLNRWLSEPDKLRLNAKKENGYLSRIIAKCGPMVLYEKHFDAGEEVREYAFEIPLWEKSGLIGKGISVCVEDEAQNVNETMYTYYLGDETGFEDMTESDNGENESFPAGTLSAENDFSAPIITISGPSDGECVKGPCEMEIEVDEECYEGGMVAVSVVRNCLGKTSCLPIPDYPLTAMKDIRKLTLNIDGDYEMRVTAADGFGNENAVERRFRIDSTAPEIKIPELEEKKVIGGDGNIDVCVREMFYDTASVNVKIEKKKSNGEYVLYGRKDYNMKEASDCFTLEKLEEGDYKMIVCANDLCGNSAESETEFLVDCTPPVIGELTDIDGMFLDSFSLKSHLKTAITDRTGVTVSTSLNDCEITENDVIIGEGRYRLLVEARDEAGNCSDREAVFVIDHTSPQIVICGADNSGNVKFGTSIKVSLFDETDSLTSVSFDGRDIAICDNEAVIKVDGYGNHKLCVCASDRAGNDVTKTIIASCPIVRNPVSKYVKVEEKQSTNLVNNDSFEKEFTRLAVGLFTVLSGTCGLSFRAFTCN